MKNAWQQLGHDVSPSSDALRAMEMGGLLEWEVRKETLETYSGKSVYGHYALTREGNETLYAPPVLSVVGSRYKITQNEEWIPLLDGLGLPFKVAGTFDSRIFVTMRYNDDMYVSLVNGFDGKLSPSIIFNQFKGSTLLTSFVLPIRITPETDPQEILKYARAAYIGWFEGNESDLENAPLSKTEFLQLIVKEYDAPASAPLATRTRAYGKLDKMGQLFGDGTTAWDGLVALCTWYDHYSPVRGPDTVRARKAIFEPAFKNRALELMRSV